MSKKQYTAFGLFSNLQGLETGARRAGFTCPFSTDYCEDAEKASPFLTEEKHTFLRENVKDLHFKDIQDALAVDGWKFGVGDVDLLLGGPPCFGMTRLSTKTRSVFHDNNLLMLDMLRIANQMQPKVVLIEQVPPIFSAQLRPFFNLFISMIERLGNYEYGYEVLNAANFGCLQSRERAIFMLVRKDLGIQPSFPTGKPIDLSKQSAFASIEAELFKTDDFKKKSRKQRLINGKTSVFKTLTSGKVEIFRNGLWQSMSIADRKVVAHMEDFDMSQVLEGGKLIKKLGMMVIPPFAEALCRHVREEILMKAGSVNIDSKAA